MSNKFLALPFVAITFLLLHIIPAQADVIHLKNKGKVEGVIESESEKHIVVNLGFGTVTISKEDIESIEKGVGGSALNKELSAEARSFSSRLKEVKEKKINAVKYRKRYDELKYKLINIERELPQLNSKVENLNNSLRRKGKDDIYAYNKLVAELNATYAQMDRMINEARTTMELKEGLEADVSRYVSTYNESLCSLEADFNKSYTNARGKGFVNDDEKLHYESLEDEIQRLKMDFRHIEIEYVARGPHVIVEALLNDSIKAKLMLDTGASSVVVFRDITSQLDLGRTSEGKVSVADGRTITATTFILKSVRIGDSRVNNVAAVILEKSEDPAIDGLLGMSFLSNFIMKVDSKGNKLILEEFRPS